MIADSSKCGEQIVLTTGLDLSANGNRNQSVPEYVPEIPTYATTPDVVVIDQATQSKLNQLQNFPSAYKKPCNCAKSHCLKLYCECFARGSACDNCNCSNCLNNVFHEEERRKAIKLTLERNPLAFHPKIGEGERKHSKGCNCKRSGCLKNYCECFEAKISCSDLCRCQGCRNFENGCDQKTTQDLRSLSLGRNKGSMVHKKLAEYFVLPGLDRSYGDPYITLPHASQLFSSSQGTATNNNPNYYFDEPLIANGFFTLEVTEAACSCMLAQLDEAKQRSATPTTQERIVLEEFGRCLEQIVDSASKLPNSTVTPENVNCMPHEISSNPDFVHVLPSACETTIQIDSTVASQSQAVVNCLNDSRISRTASVGRVETYDNKDLELLRYSEPLDPSFGSHLYVPQTDKYTITDNSNVEELEATVVPYQVDPSIGPSLICPPMMKLMTGTEVQMSAVSGSNEQHFSNHMKPCDPEQLSFSNFHSQESCVTELGSPRMSHLTTASGVLTLNTSSNILPHSGSIPIRQSTMGQDGRILMAVPNLIPSFVGLKHSDDEDEEAHKATVALLSDASCEQHTSRFTELVESSILTGAPDPFVYRNLSILEVTSPTNNADGSHSDNLDLHTDGSHSSAVSISHFPVAVEQSFQTSLLSETENYDPVSYTNHTVDENARFLKQEMDFFDL